MPFTQIPNAALAIAVGCCVACGTRSHIAARNPALTLAKTIARRESWHFERFLSGLSVEASRGYGVRPVPAQKAASDYFPEGSRGWGFGVSILAWRRHVAAVPRRSGKITPE